MKKVISFPQPVPVETGDSPCQESDGCPTERAVLQRFWREHHADRTQGADEPLTNHERIELYELRDAVSRLADDAQPVAIYQVWDGDKLAWLDVQPEYYAERLPSNRRIVYATRDAAPRTGAPSFDAKHVSLKQKGDKIILTLELDGVEGSPRYAVTPINPGVVRVAASDEGQMSDREEFEAWMKSLSGYPFAGQFANLMWAAWQAARATPADHSRLSRQDDGNNCSHRRAGIHRHRRRLFLD